MQEASEAIGQVKLELLAHQMAFAAELVSKNGTDRADLEEAAVGRQQGRGGERKKKKETCPDVLSPAMEK